MKHPHLSMLVDTLAGDESGRNAPLDAFLSLDETKHTQLCIFFTCTEVSSPVTVWAKGDHVPRVIWPSISKASNVVCFQIGRAVWPYKWSSCTAVFAVPLCSREYIGANNPAPFKRRSHSLHLAWSHFRRLERLRAQSRQTGVLWCSGNFIGGRHGRQRPKFKYDGLSELPYRVRCVTKVEVLKNKLVFKSDARGNLSKDKNVPALLSMISHGTIAPDHLHVTRLTFARILKDSVSSDIILVSVSFALLPGYQEDRVGRIRGGDNAPLLLATKVRMDVLSTAIDLSFFETPDHARALQFASLQAKHMAEIDNRELIDGYSLPPTKALVSLNGQHLCVDQWGGDVAEAQVG